MLSPDTDVTVFPTYALHGSPRSVGAPVTVTRAAVYTLEVEYMVIQLLAISVYGLPKFNAPETVTLAPSLAVPYQFKFTLHTGYGILNVKYPFEICVSCAHHFQYAIFCWKFNADDRSSDPVTPNILTPDLILPATKLASPATSTAPVVYRPAATAVFADVPGVIVAAACLVSCLVVDASSHVAVINPEDDTDILGEWFDSMDCIGLYNMIATPPAVT
ncbi:hypothetical protein [uncultured Duncaniella sp.]|uniref:hypothetical protein n=1 Tax=uncultured Duncaniella sp. TaxID=2768039 RepID=UPI00262CC361|nr:hypothetical protein [uncultured Duncaniella sp.]